MYQEDDTIRIKHDLKCTLHNGWGVSPEMQAYSGQSSKIRAAGKDTMGFPTFELEIDDGKFVWTKGMFEDVTNIDKTNSELLHDIESKVHGQHQIEADLIHGERPNLLKSTFGLSTPDLLGIYKIDKAGELEDTSGRMTIEKYNAAIDEQIERCTTLLTSKRGEYATDVNPLNNFNRAGNLLYKTPVGALSGMMAKHTISVYDMMNDHENGIKFTKEKWDEKITDHINYLLILQAILEDERGKA